MSGPLTSLSSGKKKLPTLAGLPPSVPPFRRPGHDAASNRVPVATFEERLVSPGNRLPPLSGAQSGTPAPILPASRSSGIASTSDSFVQAMTGRLARLEQDVLNSRREVLERDARILQLEQQLDSATSKRKQQHAPPSPDDHTGPALNATELQRENEKLRREIADMTKFLADYGLEWVGSSSSHDDEGTSTSTASTGTTSVLCPSRPTLKSTAKMWSQSAATLIGVEQYDRILEDIAELNALAGDGVAVVARTGGRQHRLTVPDPISITFFANGVMLYAGPARPLETPLAQSLLRDLLDGYFPSELKERHPNGVPLRVHDRRSEPFSTAGRSTLQRQPGSPTAGVFEGTGQQLGGAPQRPSRLLDATSATTLVNSARHNTTDSFLANVPKTVVRDGMVVDVRAGLAEHLQLGAVNDAHSTQFKPTSSHATHTVGPDLSSPTPRLARASASTSASIQVRTGSSNFVVYLPAQSTIAHLRRELAQRGISTDDYTLRSTFPARAHDDDSASLQACGLTPSGTIFLHKRPSNSLKTRRAKK